MYAIRPSLTARPSAAPALGRTTFWPAVTRSIRPPAIFFLHDPPEPQPSGLAYSILTEEYASVVPPPAMPPSHQPVPSRCASWSTEIGAGLVQRPERGGSAGGDGELHGAARERPVARHARVRRLREDVRGSPACDVDGVALLTVTAEPREQAAVLGEGLHRGGGVDEGRGLWRGGRCYAGDREKRGRDDEGAHGLHRIPLRVRALSKFRLAEGVGTLAFP
jgi:hypothetical protein